MSIITTLTRANPPISPGDFGRGSSSVHSRLEANTAVVHQQVEKAFNLKRRIATWDGYRDALSALRDIHCAVQQSLDQLTYKADFE